MDPFSTLVSHDDTHGHGYPDHHEEERARLAARIAELEEEKRMSEAELVAARWTRDEFMALASHELRTPLASLSMFVTSILRHQERLSLAPEELGRRLRKVDEQCVRLTQLVSRLVDASHAGTGALLLHPEEMDLTEVVEATMKRFAARATSARCKLTLRSDGKTVGWWDRSRVEQIVLSLLLNAARFARGGAVDVSLNDTGDAAVLHVQDEGPGVAVADRCRIFQRNVQVESGAPSGGLGLGLWMVQEIARAHGGSASVIGTAGHGAHFVVVLPRQQARL
jgi:two-component system OmpR family sensor kinase